MVVAMVTATEATAVTATDIMAMVVTAFTAMATEEIIVNLVLMAGCTGVCVTAS